MKLNALLDEGRFILSPDRPDAPLVLPPITYGDTEPVELRVFEKGLTANMAVDPSTYLVTLSIGIPNARPTLGFWQLTTTQGDSGVMESRATATDVEAALALAFGPVTVEGGEGSYLVTVTTPSQWATPVPSFAGLTISGVDVFENTPGTATTGAQYRITVQEAAPASIAPENWVAGSTSPISTFAQVQGRLWQLTLGQNSDSGFYTLTIDGVTTEFISVFAGAYQLEMVLSVAGKPAQVQPDGVGGFYVMFSEDVTVVSVGGHVMSQPYVTGSLDLTSPALRELLDGVQFIPVSLSVSLTKDGTTSSFTTDAILQMPINASVQSQYLTQSAGDLRYLRFLPGVTGYTGGGSTNLDGVPTVGLSVPLFVIFNNPTDGGRIYELRAGTDASNPPSVIVPADFSPSNQKVWQSVL